MVKTKGEAEVWCNCDNSEFYFEASLFFSYKFLRFVCFCFYVSLLSSSSSPFEGNLHCGWNTVFCLIVFAFVCSRRSILRSLLRRQRENLKATEIGLLRCHMAINNYDATMKLF